MRLLLCLFCWAAAAGDRAVIEVDRTVNANGIAGLAGAPVSVGYQLAELRVTLRMEGPLLAVIRSDGWTPGMRLSLPSCCSYGMGPRRWVSAFDHDLVMRD